MTRVAPTVSELIERRGIDPAAGNDIGPLEALTDASLLAPIDLAGH